MRLIFHGSALPPHVVEEAEDYDNPKAMFNAGIRIEHNSVHRVIGGLGIMFAGGALSVIQRRQQERLSTVRPSVLVASGSALAAAGVYGLFIGDMLQDAASQISEAASNGLAEIDSETTG